jgi:hypothetical protein
MTDAHRYEIERILDRVATSGSWTRLVVLEALEDPNGMCNFLSALILKNGTVLHHPMLDSHSDLVRYFKLHDNTPFLHHFAKVELTPGDWADVSTWQWKLDEPSRPVWFTEEAEHQAERHVRDIAKRMILRDGEHELIVDGCWIVCGTAKVRDVRGGRIVRVEGSAQITHVRGSAQITDVGDSAQITDVGGSATLDQSARAHVR